MLNKNCEICGIIFSTFPSRLKIGNGRFCSNTCAGMSRRGIKKSDEIKMKISKSNIKRFENNPHLRQQIANKLKGDKSPLWWGGVSKIKRNVILPIKKKREILDRDNHTCQMCGVEHSFVGDKVQNLDTHHIDYNWKNHNDRNIIALCRHCHLRTNTKRDYWQNLLEGMMIKRFQV